MTVDDNTATSVLAGQTVGDCVIYEVAETDRESYQYLKIGAAK